MRISDIKNFNGKLYSKWLHKAPELIAKFPPLQELVSRAVNWKTKEK